MNGLASTCDGLYASKGSLDLALDNDEGLLEVILVRRWAAARWDVHVDEAKPSGGVLPGQKSCVGVPNQSDVR